MEDDQTIKIIRHFYSFNFPFLLSLFNKTVRESDYDKVLKSF